MVKTGESDLRRAQTAGPPRSFPWSRLISSETPADVLEELALWLGAGTAELVLESTVASAGRIAGWSSARPPRGPRRRRTLTIRGKPAWRLTVIGLEVAPSRELVESAAVALEAWREAQLELGRAEARLAARTQELDVIQALGRRAAEARSPYDLFVAAIETLQHGEELDLAIAAYSLDGAPEIFAFLARPFEEDCLEQLAARAAEMLGWAAEAPQTPRRVELPNYDAAHGLRRAFSEKQLVVLPILRRETAVACLLVVPAVRADEADLRLVYSAANQLCLHLDRILTVREAEADRFRSILDSMPQAVLLADHALRIVQLNRSARRLFEELGLPAAGSLEPVLERLEMRALVDRVLRGESAEAGGEALVGTDRMFSYTVTPLAGRRREELWMVLVLSDVTESRRLQQQLAHSEKMSSLGQMISGIAHELNNPLTSILGYTQLLGASQNPEQLAQRVDVLASEAERCRRIVQNLLSFARRRRPEREPLSLNQVIQAVLSLMGYQLRVEDIRVRTELSPELPMLHGDPHELQQVLVNLLTNAQQAIRRSGVGGGEISLRSEVSAGGEIVLEVHDTGPGIPESIRGKIFDPFFTTKEEGKGTGLGLSLVYGIVRSHGGTIEALPSTDGATFRVTLPGGSTGRPKRNDTPPSEQTARARPSRILVVDDELSLARLICEALEEDGHLAEFVGDGHQALRRLAERDFDLIISDIKMPGMGGERLYQEVQRSRPEVSRRLMLTTGDTVGDGAQQVVERTGLELLHKPFDLEHLRRVVRSRLAALHDGAEGER